MNRPAPWRSMLAGVESRRPFRVGGATVDPVSRDAHWRGGHERLQPQMLKVLLVLVSRRGEVVTRDELVQLCWDGRIVGDDVINRSILLLRHFAEQAGGFEIETVPRTGYRLLEKRSSKRPNRIAIAAAVAGIAIVAVGTVAFQRFRNSEPKMLAVLPFQASDGANADLADGLSEELLSQLSESQKLRVIGRASAWQFKGKAVDLRNVGRQLGADYLVDGDVANDGGGIRVTVSLVRASDGTTMWSQVFSGAKNDTPQLRAAIGTGVGNALGIPPIPSGFAYKPNGEAYALYLRGKALFRKRDNTSLENARALMLSAISIDPKFAAPWAYAGGITHLLNEKTFQLDPSRPGSPSFTPVQALNQSLKLDPNFADAHGFLGWISNASSVEAMGHLQRAVELAPNDSQILFWWSQGLLRQGNWPEYAKVAYKDAALDPLWPKAVTEAATASFWTGNRATEQRYLQRIQKGNPSGAVEVESAMAAERLDLSRVVELGLRDKSQPFQQTTYFAATALLDLGFEREGRLIGHAGVNDLIYNSSSVPNRATLLKLAREDPENFDYGTAFAVLRLHGRYSDIVALYDTTLNGDLAGIRQATFANRQIRMEFCGLLAQALDKVNRKAEAAQMLRLADDADHAVLGYGESPFDDLSIAGNEAIAGRREEAIQLLERATAKGMYIDPPPDGAIDPVFENLKGDPRFTRIYDAAIAKKQLERKKVLALGIL
ncbi:MAG TPA: winged helix-turn-helix domain-containing protein [Sphingomicrobium sp.]|nr:winged helix-turn-helix domain-containing protein [Sphingomicrobium sp.]